MQKFPIYIPSKGRAERSRTVEELEKGNCTDYFIVVEPQDYEAYSEAHHEKNLLCLDKNDEGIYYVRNFILQHALNNGYEYVWQVDDDLQFARHSKNSKPILKPIHPTEAFIEIEQVVEKFSNIGVAGVRDSTYAWSQPERISINKQASGCWLIKTDTGCKFRKDIIEDTDFNMQILVAGYCTLNFNRLVYVNPPTGTVEGGNSNVNFLLQQKNLVKAWHGCFTLKYNRIGTVHTENLSSRIAPSRIWSKFPQRPKRKV